MTDSDSLSPSPSFPLVSLVSLDRSFVSCFAPEPSQHTSNHSTQHSSASAAVSIQPSHPHLAVPPAHPIPPLPPDPPPARLLPACEGKVLKVLCPVCDKQCVLSYSQHWNECDGFGDGKLPDSFLQKVPNLHRCTRCRKMWFRSANKELCGKCTRLGPLPRVAPAAPVYPQVPYAPAVRQVNPVVPLPRYRPVLPESVSPAPVHALPSDPFATALSESELEDAEVALSLLPLGPGEPGLLLNLLRTPIDARSSHNDRKLWTSLASALGLRAHAPLSDSVALPAVEVCKRIIDDFS
jgi:hypothetical protein